MNRIKEETGELPQRIQGDNGAEFISKELVRWDYSRLTIIYARGRRRSELINLQYKSIIYLVEGQFKGEKYSETILEKYFHKYLGKMCKNHNFTQLCFRHCYAIHLLEEGVCLRYIRELLGHKNSRTTEIYTHVSMTGLQNIKNPADDFDL